MAKPKVGNILRGGGKGLKVEVAGLKDLERKLKSLSKDNPELKLGMQSAVGAGARALRKEMVARAQAAGWGSQHITAKIRAEETPGRKWWKEATRWVYRAGSISGRMAINSIFNYTRPKPGGDSGRQRISALVGITKPETMVEWIAGKRGRRGFNWGELPGKRNVAAGGRVAMAFATMLEFGTSRMRPRPAIRPAAKAGQGRVIQDITTAYQDLINRFSK